MPRKPNDAVRLTIRMPAELRTLVHKAAKKAKIHGGMGAYVVSVLAADFGRPDLDFVPIKERVPKE